MTNKPSRFRVIQKLTLIIPIALCVLSLSSAIKGQESSIAETPRLLKVPPSGYRPQPETEASRHGEQLFKDLNCVACHSIRNIGGTMGPMFDAIGSKRTEEFVIARLSNNPEKQERFNKLTQSQEHAPHPHIRITDRSSRLIAKFLMTLPEPPGGFVVIPHRTRFPAPVPTPNPSYRPSPATESSRQGADLYSKLGCAACHSFGNIGGWLGPKLDGVGGRLSRESMVSYITNAQAYALATRSDAAEYPSQMPQLTANPDDIQKIADFLRTLP